MLGFRKGFPWKRGEKHCNKNHWPSITFNVNLMGRNLQHERKRSICVCKAIHMFLFHEQIMRVSSHVVIKVKNCPVIWGELNRCKLTKNKRADVVTTFESSSKILSVVHQPWWMNHWGLPWSLLWNVCFLQTQPRSYFLTHQTERPGSPSSLCILDNDTSLTNETRVALSMQWGCSTSILRCSLPWNFTGVEEMFLRSYDMVWSAPLRYELS